MVTDAPNISRESAATPAEPTPRDVHVFCMCRPDVGLCGTDLTGRPRVTDRAVTCSVCGVMMYGPCPNPDCQYET
jgi:hypothetical protein